MTIDSDLKEAHGSLMRCRQEVGNAFGLLKYISGYARAYVGSHPDDLKNEKHAEKQALGLKKWAADVDIQLQAKTFELETLTQALNHFGGHGHMCIRTNTNPDVKVKWESKRGMQHIFIENKATGQAAWGAVTDMIKAGLQQHCSRSKTTDAYRFEVRVKVLNSENPWPYNAKPQQRPNLSALAQKAKSLFHYPGQSERPLFDYMPCKVIVTSKMWGQIELPVPFFF
ncbi:MAG: hypothetical protein V3T84_06345 [Phycisphaerales bacterium]